MKNNNLLALAVISFFLYITCSYAQASDVDIDITYPTLNGDCLNGEIALSINGGFVPYYVIWYRVVYYGVNSYQYIVQNNRGIQSSIGFNNIFPSISIVTKIFASGSTDYSFYFEPPTSINQWNNEKLSVPPANDCLTENCCGNYVCFED